MRFQSIFYAACIDKFFNLIVVGAPAPVDRRAVGAVSQALDPAAHGRRAPHERQRAPRDPGGQDSAGLRQRLAVLQQGPLGACGLGPRWLLPLHTAVSRLLPSYSSCTPQNPYFCHLSAA